MNHEDQIEAIGAIFRCERDSASTLADIVSVHQHAAGDVLASQGGPANHFWLVTEGAVRVDAFGVDGQRQQLAQYGPGEGFGAFPEASTHRAEISAASEATLLRFEATRLAAVVAGDAQVGAGMARLLARQLDRALDRMVTRTTYSAAGRVYAELLSLAGESARIAPPPKITALALSANTTRETASRAIAVLIRRGIVTRDDTCLVIASPRMLMDLIS